VVNQPLSDSIDLTVGYSYLDSEATVVDEGTTTFDVSAQSLNFGGTYHMKAGSVKPYASLGLAWGRYRAAGVADDDLEYILGAGVEIPAGSKAALTPFVTWKDTLDKEADDEGSWNFGAMADFDITTSVSLLAKAMVDDDSNWGYSAGVLFRF